MDGVLGADRTSHDRGRAWEGTALTVARRISDMENRALDAVEACLRRRTLTPGAFDRAMATLRAFRSVRRRQANRDRNEGADLGGEG